MTDDLQLRLCDDSGTGTIMAVKRELVDADDADDEDHADDPEDDDQQRLRIIKDPCVDDGGGSRCGGGGDASPSIKSETGVSSSDAGVVPDSLRRWSRPYTDGVQQVATPSTLPALPYRPDVIFNHRATPGRESPMAPKNDAVCYFNLDSPSLIV